MGLLDTGHLPGRPSWDCLSCERPWPCDPAREHLITHLDPVALRTLMWMHLEEACRDMPVGPPAELFERFLYWTSVVPPPPGRVPAAPTSAPR